MKIARNIVWTASLSFLGFVSCGPVKSTVSSVSAIIPGVELEKEERIKAGRKLNLNVSPQMALMLFRDVAKENGWEVSAMGDQRNINGEVAGKFFRVETVQFVGGRRIMSGVFFKEKDDDEASYVAIGKPGPEAAYGIPTALAKPLLVAIAEWTGEVDETFETVEDETEWNSPEGALGEDSEERGETALEEREEFEETEFNTLEEYLDSDPTEAYAREDVELSPEEEEILEEIELGPIE